MDRLSGVLSSVLSTEMKLNKLTRDRECRILESRHPCKSNNYDSSNWSISFPDASFLTVHIDKRTKILSSSISFTGSGSSEGNFTEISLMTSSGRQIDVNSIQDTIVVHGPNLNVFWTKTKNYENPNEEYWGLKIVVVPHYKDNNDNSPITSSWLLDLTKSLCFLVGKVGQILHDRRDSGQISMDMVTGNRTVDTVLDQWLKSGLFSKGIPSKDNPMTADEDLTTEEKTFLRDLTENSTEKSDISPAIHLHHLLRRSHSMGGPQIDLADRRCVAALLRVSDIS